MKTTCRACREPSRDGLLVCPKCWAKVPDAMQRAFTKATDRGAVLCASADILAHLKTIIAEQPELF